MSQANPPQVTSHTHYFDDPSYYLMIIYLLSKVLLLFMPHLYAPRPLTLGEPEKVGTSGVAVKSKFVLRWLVMGSRGARSNMGNDERAIFNLEYGLGPIYANHGNSAAGMIMTPKIHKRDSRRTADRQTETIRGTFRAQTARADMLGTIFSESFG
jgi:hypothetical protein